MDHGWIVTAGSDASMAVQMSFACEGRSGSPVPDLSIEVDDIAPVLERARRAKAEVVYGPAEEPWGVRRFYLRDPAGRLVDVLMHI
jgi:catechol 2,3-dioxygenase-like lactoylglutathione lyase family enzyme